MVIKENTVLTNKKAGLLRLDQSALYRICIQGDLAEYWSDRLGGMRINKQIQEDGSFTTTLEGWLIDQAALFGVLKALYDMRLPLISVECLEPVGGSENPSLKVSVKQKPAYLEFIVTGTFDLDAAIEKFPLVITACRQTGMSRALVDYRLLEGEIMATQELIYAHRVGEFYQEHISSGGQPLKASFVGNEILPWKAGQEVGKTYGLETLMTSDYQEAVDWLCKEP